VGSRHLDILPETTIVASGSVSAGPGEAHIPDLVGRGFAPGRPDVAWCQDIERHEALSNLAVVKGHRLRSVAADWVKLRAA